MRALAAHHTRHLLGFVSRCPNFLHHAIPSVSRPLSQRPQFLMSAARPPPPALPTHISGALAAEVDQRLMDPRGVAYSLDQLMELAGLSCAEAICDFVMRKGMAKPDCSVVFVCGPGNNGGDGLVAARHLVLRGFAAQNVSVVCPVNKFEGLTRQLKAFGVSMRDEVPEADVVVDAVFGFSFRGPPLRPPFDKLIQEMRDTKKLLVSIDVPSGWSVDEGNIYGSNGVRHPDALVSLTTPKLGTQELPPTTLHYVGGRFVPPDLALELGFQLPEFEGLAQIKLLGT